MFLYLFYSECSKLVAMKYAMDRGAWHATVHGVTRVGHNLATKPPPRMCYFNI